MCCGGAVSFAAFKREIEKRVPGAVLEDDGVCYRLTAPHRQRWSDGLHEYVAQHRHSLDDPRWVWPTGPKEAIDDLKGRVNWSGTTVPCVGECEWCDDDETNSEEENGNV
jgi:hypothetical protein